ncbi:MAG: UDPGP type 1 family protein [Phycisphaerae bacterium]|nr:UDPGP type 1 family protein [Phycisphaerae bacterium]
MTDLATIKQALQARGQSHLLRFWDELPQPQQEALLRQLAAIDFDLLDALIDKCLKGKQAVFIGGQLVPPQVLPARPADRSGAKEYQQARRRGTELLKAGKVAAFVVAGGQGTRLGHQGPKGCFEATPVAHKPLFQVFAEQIRAASNRSGKSIPWYVLTSPDNHVPTRAFFRRNHHFGLNADDVMLFPQGTVPAIGFDGKLLLTSKGSLADSPNGHGGSLPALQQSGALDDMAERGVELISYFQVDNPLVRCIDQLFLGLHDLRDAEMSAKAVPKREAMEKLGNFCVVDGKVTVIEYSDMPKELARATSENGRLRFSVGSIAVHVLSRSFVQRLTKGRRCDLPLHRAEKTVPYVNPAGKTVKPARPNAVKLEMFIFDAMALTDKTLILQTERNEEFSPVKNARGIDSPLTALRDQVRRAAAWLEAAGVAVPRDAEGQVAAAIEISPLFADSAEELARKIDPNLTITSGQQFYLGSRGQLGGTQ